MNDEASDTVEVRRFLRASPWSTIPQIAAGTGMLEFAVKDALDVLSGWWEARRDPSADDGTPVQFKLR